MLTSLCAKVLCVVHEFVSIMLFSNIFMLNWFDLISFHDKIVIKPADIDNGCK